DVRAAVGRMVQTGEILLLDQVNGGARLDGRSFVVTTSGWDRVTTRVEDLLRRFHGAYPLRRGLPKEELRTRLGAEPRLFVRELERLKAQGAQNTAKWSEMSLAKRWLHRDDDKIPQGVKPQMLKALAQSEALTKLVAMREELRQLWTRTNVSAEQLVADLQAWCKRAEESGIAALQEFSLKLRAAHA
ncbi:MAG TPA: DNA/RNA-binding winged helix domain-containing protein, partial [Burkholderiaceae bacterium]|nr:DNA/RNA-binding winged helix domain-containing protein [Burkholderiaceae bacterium]